MTTTKAPSPTAAHAPSPPPYRPSVAKRVQLWLAGHFVMLEKPQAVNRRLERFIARLVRSD